MGQIIVYDKIVKTRQKTIENIWNSK